MKKISYMKCQRGYDVTFIRGWLRGISWGFKIKLLLPWKQSHIIALVPHNLNDEQNK